MMRRIYRFFENIEDFFLKFTLHRRAPRPIRDIRNLHACRGDPSLVSPSSSANSSSSLRPRRLLFYVVR